MNCLNFNNKNTYMDFVCSLSKEQVVLQRRIHSNLLLSLKNMYSDFRKHISSCFLLKAKELQNNINISSFKSLLEDTFNYSFSKYNYLSNYLKFDNSNLDDDGYNYNYEESINLLDENYTQIKETYNKFHQLLNLIINQTAIFAYRLFGETYLDKKELAKYDNAPFVIFGGKNKNGQPDYSYTLERYIYQLSFNLNFVEGKI